MQKLLTLAVELHRAARDGFLTRWKSGCLPESRAAVDQIIKMAEKVAQTVTAEQGRARAYLQEAVRTHRKPLGEAYEFRSGSHAASDRLGGSPEGRSAFMDVVERVCGLFEEAKVVEVRDRAELIGTQYRPVSMELVSGSPKDGVVVEVQRPMIVARTAEGEDIIGGPLVRLGSPEQAEAARSGLGSPTEGKPPQTPDAEAAEETEPAPAPKQSLTDQRPPGVSDQVLSGRLGRLRSAHEEFRAAAEPDRGLWGSVVHTARQVVGGRSDADPRVAEVLAALESAEALATRALRGEDCARDVDRHAGEWQEVLYNQAGPAGAFCGGEADKACVRAISLAQQLLASIGITPFDAEPGRSPDEIECLDEEPTDEPTHVGQYRTRVPGLEFFGLRARQGVLVPAKAVRLVAPPPDSAAPTGDLPGADALGTAFTPALPNLEPGADADASARGASQPPEETGSFSQTDQSLLPEVEEESRPPKPDGPSSPDVDVQPEDFMR